MLSLPEEKGLLVFLINWSFCSLRRSLSASDIYTLREEEEEEEEKGEEEAGKVK